MQPTAPQSTGGGDMDLPTVQSMDWVFQNKQLYFLAQYLAQQAEKKEKLSTTATTAASMDGSLSAATTTTAPAATTTHVSSPLASSTIIEQNGVTPPSPSTTPLSDAGSVSGKLMEPGSSPDKPGALDGGDSRLDLLKDAKAFSINNNSISSNNNNKSDSCSGGSSSNRVSPAPEKDGDSRSGVNSNEPSSTDKSSNNVHSNSNNDSSSNNNNSSSSSGNEESDESKAAAAAVTDSAAESRTTKSLAEELSAKNREISALFEEVARLRTAIANIQESHNLQIQRLEDRLEEKRQHIVRLESRIEKQQDFDDLKKENNILRSVDLSSPHDSKQFQELLLERTKALAAQTEAIKSSNSEDLTQHEQDKASSHHDNSSSASTPILQDTSRHDEHMNGGGFTPMRMSKSPLEDNNNTLGPLSHPGPGLIQGLPFQFQERGHFRFAEDLQLPPGSMAGRLGDSLIPKGDPMEAKLQEMLRYNMDKYANQNLDTLHISRRVRELLSVHNIGQRLFAKYVLGLSQGTVSELLSKPKPWDKLTEKGRDSYRKMHAWACDENAVLLLKSLIPKKEPGMPSFGRPEGSDMNDDRIHHILTEAQSMIKRDPPGMVTPQHPSQQMHHQQLQLQQSLLDDSQHSDNDSKSPHHRDVQSPFAKDYLNRRAGSRNNEDIPQDKIAKIYQEEFSKLMRSPREFPNFLFPHFLSGGMPPMERLQDDNIRMALEAYHRELAKLQQNAGSGMPAMPNISNLPNFLALHQQQQQQQQQQQAQQHAAAVQQQQQQNQQVGLNGSVQDLSLPKEKQSSTKLNGSMTDLECEIDAANKEVDDAMKHSAFSLVKPKPEPGTCTPTTTASSAPSPISNSILPPVMPTEDMSVTVSPLQRMASITNSLITQPPVTPHHSSQQRPLKAILPPITQQQFDLYNNLNTEDIVRRVKESLSQYSISQRLFGESVLGLSQGSVSDLLARPKPWHMLTQKGREPFIRMKMFLEDDNAVHKLVASQYKIAPEKLMRTGNYSGSPQIPGMMVKQMPPLPKMLSDSINKLQQDQKTLLQLQMSQMQQMPPTSQAQQLQQHQQQLHQQQMAAAAAAAQHHAQQEVAARLQQQQQQQQQQQHQPPSSQPSPIPPQPQPISQSNHQRQQPSPQTMLLTPPGIPPQHAIPLQTPGAPHGLDKKQIMLGVHSPQQTSTPNQQQPGPPPPSVNSMRGALHQHISPTVYEMAALTQDLDTQTITTKIKEALLANNIGQKIFGEAVLGLSQGSVSELLSKPKPWHMLSIKGREPFIRMQLWLSDANNVERLQMLKNERREASKRRRSTGPGAQDNSSDTSSNDTSEFYHSNSPGPGSVGSGAAPPNKKQRVLFSEEQKEALRLAFALDPYPNVQTIEFLATELGLSTRTITNWFHNHRMRLKQQVPHGQPSEPIPSRENQSGAPFDPVQFRVLLSQRLMEIQKERMGLSGVPLPYPPYFAANPNLAALIGRGFIPGDVDLAALNKAVSEQMSGLDLSMPSSVKREGEEEFDEDSESGHMSDSESMNGGARRGGDGDEHSVASLSLAQAMSAMSRISRRKPAAPQWVNPDWQDDKNPSIPGAGGDGKKDGDLLNGIMSDGVPSVQQRFVAAMAAAAAAVAAAASGGSDNEQDDAKSTHSKQSVEEQRDGEDDDCREEKDESGVSGGVSTVAGENGGEGSEKDKELVQVKTELMEETERWEY